MRLSTRALVVLHVPLATKVLPLVLKHIRCGAFGHACGLLVFLFVLVRVQYMGGKSNSD